jgi:uncharacterized repeat protein (TIGR01451 family)
MKKILEKSLNNALVLLLVLNLVSYQIILPITISHAEDTVVETTENTSESSPADSSDEADDEADTDEEDDAAEAEDTSPAEAQTEEEDDEVTPAATEELAPVSSVESVVVPEAVLPSGEDSAEENADVCACRDVADENANNEQASCPSDCACCQTEVVQVNVAEDVASTAEALSETGNNTVTGEVAIDQTVQLDPATDETLVVTQEETNNDGEDDNDNDSDSCEHDCGDDAQDNQAVVVTGDALAGAESVNHINTNIYTDNGVQFEENITGEFAGDINLVEVFEDVLDGAQKLNEENEKAFEQIVVTNVNVAEKVENTVIANADSGDNLVEAIDGIAEVATGTAQAVASAVNFVNTNIVGNNWLLAEINIFGNWTGNLIVPGEGLLDLPSAGMIFESITNTNLAKSITNFLSADANSGDNSVSSVSGDVEVVTGDAVAVSSGTTLVNTNIVNNNWFLLMINNAGSWTGQVFNWNNGEKELAYEYDFGSLEGADAPVTKYVSVNNYNSAEEVTNSVSASANSGGNVVSEVAGDVSVKTGDAVALASAFNFINTNIVGNNWFMAVVNNAGTWSGDLIFGYPDLSVDLSADKNSLEPGKDLTYTLHYRNNGQAKCGNVELMLSLPENLFYQSDSLGAVQKRGNDYFWKASGLRPGEERTFSVRVLLDPKTKSGDAELESLAAVKTDTQEVELNNNYATDSISVTFSQVTIQEGLPEKDGKLSVKREGDSSVAVGSISTQTIFVKNSGKETLYNLEVKEGIKNPAGEKMVEYIWPIEKLKKGQTATIQYQIFAGPELALGNYRHSASAKGLDQYGREVESEKASVLVAFFRPASEAVALGGTEENSALSAGADGATEVSGTAMPEILGMASETRNINWQWLLLLLLVPVAYYVRKEKVYRWEKIQKFSRQMGSFLSSFL